MRTFLIRLLVNAVALWVATLVVSGIKLESDTTGGKILTLLIVAAIFGLVNAIIKPVVKLFTLPLFVLTLGLITFLVNALMLWLTGAISHGTGLHFSVEGFWAAFWGALVISVVSWILNLLLPD
jgi:putative membrane protein